MEKQQLLDLGLTEEQATSVLELHKTGLKDYIPKSRFDEVNNAKKKAEDDVKARDAQIEELKKVDGEGLKAKIEELQTANKQASEKYEADLKDFKLTSAIKAAITNAQDLDLVSGLIDKTKLVLAEDGTVSGLTEQVKALQECKPYLFKETRMSGFKPNQSTTTQTTAEAQAIGAEIDKYL